MLSHELLPLGFAYHLEILIAHDYSALIGYRLS